MLTAQKITVEITDWACAAGTKVPPTQRFGSENLPKDPVKRKTFWGSSKSEAAKVAPPAPVHVHQPWRTHIARYAVYSAKVTTSPSKDLHKGLKAMTKKDPPSHFDFEMVYVSLLDGLVVDFMLTMNAVLQRGTR